MKKILLSTFCAFVFFGCGDSGDSDSKNDLAESSSSKSYLVEFSQEELKNENYVWAFNKIKKELHTDNLKFYKLESIRYLYPSSYSAYALSQSVAKFPSFRFYIYVIDDEHNIPYFYVANCYGGCKKEAWIHQIDMSYLD